MLYRAVLKVVQLYWTRAAADDTAEHLRDCTWLGRHATHVWVVSDKRMCVTGRCQSAHESRPTEPSVEIPS